MSVTWLYQPWGMQMTKSGDGLPVRMTAVLLTGHGGPECLQLSDDVPVPVAGAERGAVPRACGRVNNTDINTRIGWYSKAVKGSTGDASGNLGATSDDNASWTGAAFKFPRIQGADCCGHIRGGRAKAWICARIGERVIGPNHAALQRRLSAVRMLDFRLGMRRRFRAIRQGGVRRDLSGRLRLERCRTGLDPLRLFDRRGLTAPGASPEWREGPDNRRIGWRRVRGDPARKSAEAPK